MREPRKGQGTLRVPQCLPAAAQRTDAAIVGGASRLYKARATASLLSISARKLWELTNRGDIPHLRIGRSVRYDALDLEAWIAQRKREANRG